MKKLDLYILKSFIGPFITTFFISMFVLIMQFVWRQIDDLVGKGLDFMVIMELMMYIASNVVVMALPLAVLLSSIMTFGNLGEHYELIALKSAGISLFKIMRSLIVVSVVIACFGFYFANNVVPVASLKLYSLLHDIRDQKPEAVLSEGVFINDFEKYSIKVDKINKVTGMMYNMLIYSHGGGSGNYEVTKADSGTLKTLPGGKYMELMMYNGHSYTDESMINHKLKNTFPFRRLEFSKQRLIMDAPNNELQRSDDDGYRSHAMMLNLSQLTYTIDSVNNVVDTRRSKDAKMLLDMNYRRAKISNFHEDSVLTVQGTERPLDYDSLYCHMDPEMRQKAIESALQFARDIKQKTNDSKPMYLNQEEGLRRYDIEWHKKFTLPVSCFLFFFIGAPLGAIIRQGGLGMPVVVSILLFIFYYITTMLCERSAREDALPVILGVWLPSFILLVLGSFLTYKSATDSEMMSSESYLKKINRLFKKIKL